MPHRQYCLLYLHSLRKSAAALPDEGVRFSFTMRLYVPDRTCRPYRTLRNCRQSTHGGLKSRYRAGVPGCDVIIGNRPPVTPDIATSPRMVGDCVLHHRPDLINESRLRHMRPVEKRQSFGLLNMQSANVEVDNILDMKLTFRLDVLLLTNLA